MEVDLGFDFNGWDCLIGLRFIVLILGFVL
jgi:hypothetical protein